MTKGYVKGTENISDFQHSDNMTQFILEKIKKTHGHFNKDYVMGFSVMESLRSSPVRFLAIHTLNT